MTTPSTWSHHLLLISATPLASAVGPVEEGEYRENKYVLLGHVNNYPLGRRLIFRHKDLLGPVSEEPEATQLRVYLTESEAIKALNHGQQLVGFLELTLGGKVFITKD